MATSPRNGKRRGLTATTTGNGKIAVLSPGALAAERDSAADPRPPSVLTAAAALDAPAKTNGAYAPLAAQANGKGSDNVAMPPNGAGLSPDSAGASTVAPHRPGRALQGYIDEANATAIRGWAWDPGTPGERIRLELLEGDASLLTAIASEDRPGLVLSGIGDGRHGFDIALPGGLLSAGRHVLHLCCAETGAAVPGSPIVIEDPTGVVTVDVAIDRHVLPPRPAGLNGAAQSAEAPDAAPPANFRAHLDEVSDTEISGWIMQRDEPSHRCIVALKEDERVLARTVGSRFRPDLAAAGRILPPQQLARHLVVQAHHVRLDELLIAFEQRDAVRRNALEVRQEPAAPHWLARHPQLRLPLGRRPIDFRRSRLALLTPRDVRYWPTSDGTEPACGRPRMSALEYFSMFLT